MSFTLIDQGSEGYEFYANYWNWKTALEIIRSMDILDDRVIRQMSYNATGLKVSVEEAHEIGSRIKNEVLKKVPAGSRIFSNLTVTDVPDDKVFYRDPDERWKNYSVTHEWLAEFADFCLRSKGFQVF